MLSSLIYLIFAILLTLSETSSPLILSSTLTGIKCYSTSAFVVFSSSVIPDSTSPGGSRACNSRIAP